MAEDQGFDDAIDIHLGTFSKSLGGQGGYIAGSTQLIDYLRGFSRSRFFSCALSPVVVAGLRKALELASTEPELRTKAVGERCVHAEASRRCRSADR